MLIVKHRSSKIITLKSHIVGIRAVISPWYCGSLALTLSAPIAPKSGQRKVGRRVIPSSKMKCWLNTDSKISDDRFIWFISHLNTDLKWLKDAPTISCHYALLAGSQGGHDVRKTPAAGCDRPRALLKVGVFEETIPRQKRKSQSRLLPP